MKTFGLSRWFFECIYGSVLCVCVHSYTYTKIHVYTLMYVYIYLYSYKYIHKHSHTYTHTYTHTDTQTHTHTHTHTYIYIYIYKHVAERSHLVGYILSHTNHFRSFNAKSCLYIYIKCIWFKWIIFMYHFETKQSSFVCTQLNVSKNCYEILIHFYISNLLAHR